MEIEQQRGISISSTVLQFPYRHHTVNLLDTPGHRDFSEDTYRVLAAVDAVVMVLDAAKGIESQTRKLFEVCRLRDIPIITFVNKVDREGHNPFDLMDEVASGLALDVKNQVLFAACSAIGAAPARGGPGQPAPAGPPPAADPNARPPQTFVILSAKDGKILERLPLAGSSDGATFNPQTREAFSTQGNGTMTIVKEKSATSFEVEQNLRTWPTNGARTVAFDSKTGHIFAMSQERGPAPTTPPPPGARAG